VSIEYIWNGTAYRQPPASPALGLDYADSILYVASQPTPTKPSVWVPIGGGPGGGPIILVSEAYVNTTSTQSITITAPATQMYAMSIYMNNPGLGSSGQTVTATVRYTAADGSGPQSITLILPLSSANVVMETYPLLSLGGTAVSITTAYGGAYNPIYSIGASLVQMPTSVQP
jgi:hypothetical protein